MGCRNSSSASARHERRSTLDKALNSDEISRTDLALIEDGLFSDLQAARHHMATFQPSIIIGPDSANSLAGQAALLSAVTTAVRAFGGAHVELPRDAANLWRGSERALLHDVVSELGGVIGYTPARVAVVIGDAQVKHPDDFSHITRATWDGWRAAVVPGHDAPRHAEDDGWVLGPLAAGALAINELFDLVKGRTRALLKSVRLDLWNPSRENQVSSTPPPRIDLPADWWLVGLGHLGQAAAWALSWLPLPEHSTPRVTLQDDEHLVEANISTSLCSHLSDLGHSKARVTSELLERAGYTTRIIERRLDPAFISRPEEQPVVLVGVDNPDTRRTIDEHGWPLVIDTGLGSGSNDFGAISIHVFPGGIRSADVPSWRVASGAAQRRAAARLTKPGFAALSRDHDICGIETLAGVNVAASFVGLVASCLGIAEALKNTSNGPTLDAVSLEMWDIEPTSVPGTRRRVPTSR